MTSASFSILTDTVATTLGLRDRTDLDVYITAAILEPLLRKAAEPLQGHAFLGSVLIAEVRPRFETELREGYYTHKPGSFGVWAGNTYEEAKTVVLGWLPEAVQPHVTWRAL